MLGWLLYRIIIFRCEIWKIWCRFVCKFSEKFGDRWKCGFFLGFCIYIGRKWFGFGFWDGVWSWVKVLILVGFDDIGCDIEVFGVDG